MSWTLEPFALVHSLVLHKWNLQVFYCGVSGRIKAWQGHLSAFVWAAQITHRSLRLFRLFSWMSSAQLTSCIWETYTYTQPTAQDKWYAYSDLDRISLLNFCISGWDFLSFWERLSAFFEFHLDVLAWASFYAVWKEIRGSQHLQVL